MTEDQAGTKICQESFNMPWVHNGRIGDRPAGPIECCASKCMAWRWKAGKIGTDGGCGKAGNVENSP